MKKGLVAWVYRNGGDCTNDGISSKHDKFILIGDGIPEIFDHDETTPALYLLRRNVFGRDIVQATDKNDGSYGMFGGNFLYSCDSRFPTGEPIRIMDRYEQ